MKDTKEALKDCRKVQIKADQRSPTRTTRISTYKRLDLTCLSQSINHLKGVQTLDSLRLAKEEENIPLQTKAQNNIKKAIQW